MKAERLVEEVFTNMSTLDAGELRDFVDLMLTSMLATMRGINGDDYVAGYLYQATKDMDPPKITVHPVTNN